MKKDIHPNYRQVVFYDTSSEFKFLTQSTIETSETIVWEDGNEYPLYKIEVSSVSPFLHWKEDAFGYCRSSREIQQKIREEIRSSLLQNSKSLPEQSFWETFLFLPHGKYPFV